MVQDDIDETIERGIIVKAVKYTLLAVIAFPAILLMVSIMVWNKAANTTKDPFSGR